jgi:hypothetical protein
MEIKFHCNLKGKKFYKVRKVNGLEVFLGTIGECKRFIRVHREKVRKHFAKNRLGREDSLDLVNDGI